LKALCVALVVVLLGVAVGAGAMFLGDRATLVPPPEARVEAFLRQLQTRRSELAMKYLSRELRAQLTASDLRHAFGALEEQLGDVDNVTADTLSYDQTSATARAVLVGPRGVKMPLDFRLIWQRGEWAIQTLPEPLFARWR
jgi:hypothetical protein